MSYVYMNDLGAYADYGWFVSEVNAAKDAAQKGGQVDGALRNVDAALATWRNGPYNLGNDPTYRQGYQTPSDFAQNAKNYIETFRPGQQLLKSSYESATHAQYQGAPGGGAVKPIDTGSGNVAADAAKGTGSDLSVLLAPISIFFGGGQGAVGSKASDVTGGAPGETIGGRVQNVVVGVTNAAADMPRKKTCEAACDESQIVWSEQAQACVDRQTGEIIADPSKDPRCTKSALPWCLAVDPLGKNCLGPVARTAAFAVGGAAVGGAGGLVVGKSSVGAVIGLFSGAVLGGVVGYLTRS